MAKTWPTQKQRRTGSHLNDPFARSDAVAARRVLRDCHVGLQELERADSGASWRLRWITQLTILRAVGHVLDKIDGARSPFLRQAVIETWASIKAAPEDNWVFFDFINLERNSILKEYRVGDRLIRPVEPTYVHDGDLPILVRHRVYSQREIIRHSISWWERLLEAVEERAHLLLRQTRQQRKTQRPSAAEQPLPAVRVELVLVADKYLTDLIFDTHGQIDLIEGVTVILSSSEPDGAELRALTVAIEDNVGVGRAAGALAQWVEQSFLRLGSAVSVGSTLVDLRTRSLRKLFAGKIARRRLAAAE